MEQARAFDPLSPEFIADPYPFYRMLREAGPVHRHPVTNSWVLTRYDDMVEVLRDDVRFSADRTQSENAIPAPRTADGRELPRSMLSADPPDHTRLRTLVNKAFTARRVRELTARIQTITEGLLGDLDGRAGADLIAEVAYPLPITVIAELIGVPPEDREDFKAWSGPIALALGPATPPDVARAALEGRNQLVAYFDRIIESRRAEPRDDLLSALVAAEDAGDVLTHGEVLAMLLLLLIAGHETTVNLIGNGVHALLRHPDQLERLRAEPSLAKSCVEECLRFDSPVQLTGRVVLQDTEVAGQAVTRRQSVTTLLASANRDPDRFPDPDVFDIARDPNPHLSFSAGIHFCLGAMLARLEAQVAIPAIVERFPKLRLASEELRWRPAVVLRGLEALPVAF